ncbi:MAG: ABC transporter transmembrane domain-containing protein [Erythrobacter sp.]|uniref:ABC transporter transmembrane domain-containing protein n=1 Tax=Erythrobacter sp. TaxID=1042 RepID=UPI002616C353|nr:ABC transporter transmembrane domain-containing protein [Erythrobacter sp.]MDJ0979632.1 ABC transporter transmembrane domain-containing protein [Erythrobacter sp.]
MAVKKTTYGDRISLPDFFRTFFNILRPEGNFYWLALVYGVGISLLSLATPISVQMLINTVANTAMATPLVVLTVTLFGLLMMFALLYALRIHLMELFSRRFYARMVAEISLLAVYAKNPFFGDARKSSLFNRYFDVINVEKAIPILFVGGFTVVLQVFTGFILVSLYHPYFLLFTLIMTATIWLIWLVWGARAVRTGIDLSHAKHGTAAWLETVGESNGFFKSQRRIDYAFQQSNAHTESYIKERKRHFRNHFGQSIAFLTLYAAASAALLGLGGWLVITNQLTLGQLVAAELVLSTAFFGVAQLGTYLTYFYDLCAAIEELSLFYDVEQEEPGGDDPINVTEHTLVLSGVRGRARHEDAEFNLEIPSGAIVMASASHHGVQRLFTNILKMHQLPEGGFATLGGVDFNHIEAHNLRKDVHVLDRASFVGMTVREYLGLSCKQTAPQRMVGALETVGLIETISTFEHGLDTPIAATGWPLSSVELQQLKLANALLEQPRILVLSKLFDLLDEDNLAAAVNELREQAYSTVIYFSNRRIDLGFDRFLHMEAKRQGYYDNFDDFCLAVNSKPRRMPGGPRPLSSSLLGAAE